MNGKKEVTIRCTDCGKIQTAIEDYTTVPFATFCHCCVDCGYWITESEWERIVT